jgi:hypothetical protein
MADLKSPNINLRLLMRGYDRSNEIAKKALQRDSPVSGVREG